MTFLHPAWLLFLAVPLLLAVWETRRRSQQLAMPFDNGSQRQGRRWAWLLLPANMLPAALLAVAVLIVCRPLEPAQPRQERELSNIEFVLDVSGSMMSQFGEKTRYDAAMKAIGDFTGHRRGDAFGLTIFGNEVLRWTPLTKDLSAIDNATPFLRPELLPHHFGGTEIGKALRFSRETLQQRGEGDRLIILLSDGQSADLSGPISRRLGADLAAENIVLYAIHIGDPPTPSDLYDLTRPTGGRVFAANNPQTLSQVFDHIDGMQAVKLKPSATRQTAAFGPFVLVGLVFSGIYSLSLFKLRYTPW